MTTTKSETTGKTGALVWITGASSGVGEGLALSFARDGYRVAASARNVESLQGLERQSANIKAFPVDVTDAEAMLAVVSEIERHLGPIELAIFNAGIFQPMTASRYDAAKVHRSMEVNYFGVVNGLAPVMRNMIGRGGGHMAIVSSVAGFRGMPKGAAYAPTKAALISLAESLYADLKLKGVRLSIINPGFIATPMTAPNTFPMPFIVSLDEAVTSIRQGLARKGGFEIVFPGRMAVMMKTLRILPYWLYFWLVGKISKRELPPPEGT